jgi:hypothetical protein
VEVTWRQQRFGTRWVAMVDGGIAGTVIPYGPMRAPRWIALVRGQRVGHYATFDEAKAAVESALTGAG